ncbi:hypothetical protein BL253_02795 [Pseudofrankia asymbiotica]|uniref:Uncharacterized protein n=2 Tax=Pseudofrankia asymbiotica TaxID=1834516 RepID=A0A1V2IJI9_9ACTN|nr:hypothetical protein BL253_02795 [Pseudofrankia asymbiotica]
MGGYATRGFERPAPAAETGIRGLCRLQSISCLETALMVEVAADAFAAAAAAPELPDPLAAALAAARRIPVGAPVPAGAT